jgi:predicted alpha/beta-hydrolase family hydrolase
MTPRLEREAATLFLRPPRARCVLALAHGAGAGMRHPFLEALASALAARRVATFRYELPYMAAGRRRIDPPEVLEACARENVAAAAAAAPDLPLFAGGKSMGGRMTSRAQAAAPMPGLRGLVLVGFPLHPAGRPGIDRAAHLAGVGVPALFLQGTRDALADLALLRPVLARVRPRPTLVVVDDADHAFHVRKASGRDDAAVIEELAEAIGRWVAR